jgi:hypothetical protein
MFADFLRTIFAEREGWLRMWIQEQAMTRPWPLRFYAAEFFFRNSKYQVPALAKMIGDSSRSA